MKNVQVSVRIDNNSADNIKIMASEYGVKKSDLMRFCLEKGVNSLKGDIDACMGEFPLEATLKAMDLRKVISNPEDYKAIMELERRRLVAGEQ